MKYWALAWKKAFFAGVLPLAAGAAIGLHGWTMRVSVSGFIENMRPTVAEVLQVAETGEDISEVRLRFTNEDGVPFECVLPVTTREGSELRTIGKANLIYDRRDPGTAQIGHVVSASQELMAAWGVLAGGTGLAAAGLWILGGQLLATLRKLRLFRNGQRVRTEVRDANLAPGMAKGRFTFAFRGPDGRWYEGRSPEMPAAMLAKWPAGTPLVVAYDETKPRERNEPDIFGLINAGQKARAQAA